MYTLEKIKKDIINTVNNSLKIDLTISDFSYPPKPEYGDLSLPLFSLAKKLKKNPNELGNLLISKIKTGNIVSDIKVTGSYLNFFLNKPWLAKNIILEIQKQKGKYGENKSGKNEKVLIEFSNANTHKEYHIGHLRNICHGDAITKILLANGYKAIPISYVNDFGIHIAKTLLNYHEFVKTSLGGKKIEDLPEEERGYVLGKIYAEASQKEKNDPGLKEKASELMKKIESRAGDEFRLWEKTRQWSIKHFDKIYHELKVSFKNILYENEFVNRGFDLVNSLLEKGILKRSQGAVIADLEKYNLGVLVVLRSDGTATYPVADLALAEAKAKKYKPKKSIYVVDVRQSLYFKQLFKLLELMGMKIELIHLAYDFVKLPSGMMSSRSGNVITFNELHREIFKKAKEEIKKRHEAWDNKKIEEVAKIIGLGAIKFEMVKVSTQSIISFDIKKALSFDGFTSTYLQYTYARIQSIFRKYHDYKFKISSHSFDKLGEKEEIELIKKLAKYPETIKGSCQNYDPSELAKYLFELAKLFNDYYHKTPVLKAEDEVRKARLAMLYATSQVLRNGLELLGIEVINEM